MRQADPRRASNPEAQRFDLGDRRDLATEPDLQQRRVEPADAGIRLRHVPHALRRIDEGGPIAPHDEAAMADEPAER